MGDSRAQIDITFHIYGRDFSTSMNINYYPEEEYGDVDKRVTDWFANCYADARFGFDTMVAKRQAEDEERFDRAQLARLQAKYGPGRKEAGAQSEDQAPA
jgi:hypothetical protein